MNFFEHQDRARRNSARLIVLFCLGIVLVVIALYLATVVAVDALGLYMRNQGTISGAEVGVWMARGWWRPDLFWLVTAATIFVIGVATAFKLWDMRKSGGAVAESLGGKLIHAQTQDPQEQMLRNVVEEMSIASGIPVPEVFVLDGEAGINAFAAGHSPSDAAVAVTRGALEKFSRDELQGVIAHEFSHILNGDMKFNMRLTAVVHGIFIIGATGLLLMRSLSFASGGRRRGKGGGGGAVLAIFFFGLALTVVGYVGMFFGRIIRAAASRQREFLADASAVQFTRNPGGISGALGKIASMGGSEIVAPTAEENSHFFFANALHGLWLQSWMSTHPPLGERIRRIDPTVAFVDQASPASPSANAFVANIGQFAPQELRRAAELRADIPEPLGLAVGDGFGAAATACALILDRSDVERARQLQALREQSQPAFVDQIERLWPQVARLGPHLRLPVLELALPTLRRLSPGQFAALLRDVQVLVEADAKLSLFEFTLQRVLLRHLADARGESTHARHRSLASLLSEIRTLLSALAWVGTTDEEAARRTFVESTAHLTLGWSAPLPREQCTLKAISMALDRLVLATPTLKKAIVEACARAVLSDRRVTHHEAELLRAVADALGCPTPPLPVAPT